MQIENLTLQGHTTNNAYAIYAPRTSHFILRNVVTKKCNYGFFTYESWLSIIEALTSENCTSVIKYAADGSGLGTGTSLTATRVAAAACVIGYDIYGLVYSTFNSCACDNASSKAYKIDVSKGITLNSCGAEGITGEVLQITYSEGVVVNGLQTWAIDGVTGQTYAYLFFVASRVALNGCYFVDFTTPRDSYNMIVQENAKVTINQTKLPSGGNTWISYSNNSVVIHLDGSGITCKTFIDAERSGIITNGMRRLFGTAAPSSSTWVRGDIIYNTSPTAGGFVGWICVTAGTPGTWKTFGAISS